MRLIGEFSEDRYSVRNNINLFLSGIAFSIVCVLSIYFGFPAELLLLLSGLMICLISLFSFKTTHYFFLVLLFLPYIYALRIHPAAIYSIFLLISTLISIKSGLWRKAKNPIWFPLLVYFLTTLPSLINTPKFLLSLRDLSNILALFFVFFASIHAFATKEKIRGVIYFFIAAVFLHTLFVVYLGLTTGTRVFGLLGVYYIDFAGLGGLLTFILLIYFRGVKRVFAAVAFVLITFGLILTQTRNAWLSFGFAIITLMIYLMVKGDAFYVKRRSIGRVLFVSVIIIGSVFIFAGSVNSKLESRVDLTNESVVSDDPVSIGTNSLASRVLIWHTAALAFLEHPYIGIGTYSFKHTSDTYYKIPKSFYKLYVEGRTPHVTYLQVLTETGVLGLIGFIFFISAIIKEMKKVLKFDKTREETVLSLMVTWSFVYIIFSMFMTESWLYGQYIVWIGMLLGFLVNNYRMLNSKIVSE